MRDRSMRGGTELAREIQRTDWSTAGEQGKLVFVVSITPSLWRNLFQFSQEGKKSSFDRPNYRSVQVFQFTIRFLSRNDVEKKFKQKFVLEPESN